MKNINKHEKAALLLAIISVLLMVISLFPGGIAEATGILQGLATGLLSGMVILLITGIKGAEIKKLSDIYNFWAKVSNTLMKTDELYSDLYHKTYHGKKDKMTYNEYGLIIQITYDCYRHVHNDLTAFDYLDIPPEYTLPELTKLIHRFDLDLNEIHSKIVKIEDGEDAEDKEYLNEIRETFFRLQHEVHPLYRMISDMMKKSLTEREKIESSLL